MPKPITLNDLQGQGEYTLDAEKYRRDTAYDKQLLDISQMFRSKTIPLTDELKSQAKQAVELRIKGTSAYTEERLQRIQDAYKQYLNDQSFASQGNTISELFIPETFNAVEDWSDDIYKIFKDMLTSIELTDPGYDLDEFLGKSLPVSAGDEQGIAKKGIMGAIPLIKQKLGLGIKNENYFFSKRDAIKKYLLNSWIKSGAEKKMFKFLFMGLISGEFCCKDTYGPTMEPNLVFKDDKGMDMELDQEMAYRFTPIDTRNLIYPKNNRNWVIELIHTNFSTIVAQCVDEKGEPIDTAPYDINMLKKVAEYLKAQTSNTARKEPPDYKGDIVNDTSTDLPNGDINIWDVDGDITLYEGHHIPLILPDRKKPYKTLVTCFNFGGDSSSGSQELNIIPIGARKTPFVVGIPYNVESVFEGDGEMAGRGIPEVIKPIQVALNTTFNLTLDQLTLGLYGVMVVDADVLKDKASMKDLTPREILFLKSLKGRKVADVIQWLQTPSTNIANGQMMVNTLTNMTDKTSRKGFPAQGLGHKASAGEVQNAAAAANRAVTKVSLKLNQLFLTVIYRMYMYNLLNSTSYFDIKMKGYKTLDKNAQVNDQNIMADPANFQEVEKVIKLTPQELFAKGIQFNITAIDSMDKKSVERQQFMQAFNILKGGGFMTDQTGMPHIMEDDGGTKVKISEYRAVKKLMDVLDYGDVFETVSAEEQQKIAQMQQQMKQEQMNSQKTNTPQVKGKPTPENVAKQANTVSSGVNV